jgi:hypothetical protein
MPCRPAESASAPIRRDCGVPLGRVVPDLARDETSGRIKDVPATKRPLPRGDHSSGPR